MTAYCVNKRAQLNGDHEVHVYGCRFLPSDDNRHYLGEFNSCQPAVAKAKLIYPTANGCATCCPTCHTS